MHAITTLTTYNVRTPVRHSVYMTPINTWQPQCDDRSYNFEITLFTIMERNGDLLFFFSDHHIIQTAVFVDNIVCQPRKGRGMQRNAIQRVCYAHSVYKVQVIECT